MSVVNSGVKVGEIGSINVVLIKSWLNESWDLDRYWVLLP